MILEGVASVVKSNYRLHAARRMKEGRRAKEEATRAEGGSLLSDRVCKSGNIDTRLAAVSRGLAIGSLFTNRNICSTVRSLANFHSFQRASNQSLLLLLRWRERERECTCYFPDCPRRAHVHTYAVRLSLIEALKASLCSDRSVSAT